MTLRGFKNRLLRTVRVALGTQPVEVNSYSQAGEDRILWFLFKSLGIDRPRYVDVGANLPDVSSNTYLFYRNGSRGVCVEPDPRLFLKLQEARPVDQSLNVAVGYDGTKELDLFCFDEPSINTLCEQGAKTRMQGGDVVFKGVTKVRVMRLEQIIKSWGGGVPEFVSLDAEGVDFSILNAFDFTEYPVPVWVVETAEYSPSAAKTKNLRIIELMKKRGFFVYADTYINTVFVDSDWYVRHSIVPHPKASNE